MINKFSGKCVECGTFCKAGTANWFAGHGVVCDRCNGFDSRAAAQPAPAPVAPVAPIAPQMTAEERKIKRIKGDLEINRKHLAEIKGCTSSSWDYSAEILRVEAHIAKLESELAALQPVVVVEEEIVTEAELAAAEAEVEAVETAEAAEIAASEDAIETATETVSDAAPAQALELYRLTVRCSDCCRRTKSSATEIAHYPWCRTLAQDPELLRTLQDKIAMSLSKRRQTKATKLNAKIDSLRDAYSAVYASVGGHSALGIHKICGTTGLHTVRAYEGTCTCPGHKAHGHCKHLRLVRDARDTMQSIKRQLRDTSDRLLAMADRATQANCEW